jgi:hypothetical protein
MVDPIATIKSCISALKPGRHAIFFEPFAGGNCMLRLAYRRILAHPQAKYLPFSATNALIHMLQMYQACMDVEPTDPAWQQMDDKWMFTPSYLFDAGKQAGGCETIIYPLHSLEDPYSSQTVSNLRIMGAEREALPGWGWEILHEFDTLMPRRVKEDLLIEGCVIFKK